MNVLKSSGSCVLSLATILALSACDAQTGGEETPNDSGEQTASTNQPENAGSADNGNGAAPDSEASPDTSPGTRADDGQSPRRAQRRPGTNETGTQYVKATPERLEMGEIPVHESVTKSVTLLNEGDRPMTIRNVHTSCGCTVANVDSGTVLEPGEEFEMQVSMSGGGNANQRLSKTVSVFIDDHPRLTIDVVGDVISFIEMTPTTLDPARMDDDTITIRSTDDQPFRILDMEPPVIQDFGDEARTEHTITIDDWDQFTEFDTVQVRFNLDHPRTGHVDARLSGEVAREIVQRMRQRRQEGTENRRPSSLTSAIRLNDLQAVQTFVEQSPETLERAERGGALPLMIAAEEGRMEILNYLIEAGADVDATNRAGRTALMLAAQEKQRDAVQALIAAGADVNARDQLGGSALLWSAAMADSDMVSDLIHAGADHSITDRQLGKTPLMWACAISEDPESIDVLVDAGADIEATDNRSMTPLMHAAQTGSSANIMRMIEHNADLDAQNNEGMTALAIAASRPQVSFRKVNILVDAGADPTIADNNGMTPLDHARQRDDQHAEQIVSLLAGLADGSGGEGGDDPSE